MRSRVAIAFFLLTLAATNIAHADTSLNQVFSQLEQEYQLPAGILGKVANVESGGRNICASSSSACGMFQWTTSSWYGITKAVFGRAYDLSGRNDPSLAGKMTATALRQALNQNSSLIQQANLDTTLGLYMCHFLGSGGCRKFFQLYIQNPNQTASSLFPREAAANPGVFNGRTLAAMASFFAQKLKVASPSVSYAGNFQDQSGISYAYSYADVAANKFLPTTFAVPTQDPSRTYQTDYSSISSSPQGFSAPTQLSQPQLVSQLPQIQQTTPVAQTGNSTQTITGVSIASSIAPKAASIIIAQPKTANPGETIVVSWASVGMDMSASCTVVQNGNSLVKGSEGTKVISIPENASTQTVTFSLVCTPQDSSQSVLSSQVSAQIIR